MKAGSSSSWLDSLIVSIYIKYSLSEWILANMQHLTSLAHLALTVQRTVEGWKWEQDKPASATL